MAINFIRLKDGINLGSLSADPSGGSKGDFYFNTSSNKFRGYDGTSWVDLATENFVTDFAANQTLSNLESPTAINQHLLPATDAVTDLGDGTHSYRRIYAQEVRAPQHTGFGGNTGQPSGNVLFGSRAPSDLTQNSGTVTLSSGVTSGGTSGAVQISTGNASVAGDINITPGLSTSTTELGDTNISGNQVVLNPTTNVSVSNKNIVDVLDPVNAQDAATKNYIDSGFANRTLSNLTSPVSFNQNLLPDGNGSRNVGGPSAQIGVVYSQSVATDSIFDANITQAVDVLARKLLNTGGAEKLVWNADDISVKATGNGNVILDPAGSGTVSVSGSTVTNAADPVNPQDLATKNYVDTTFIPASEKGANNGVATLDGGGKVPVTQLPNSIMTYEGLWDAATNTPTLADGVGSSGMVYRVNVAGTQDLGSGPITFDVGDYVIYNGTVWEKSDTTDAVVSVNGQTGIVVLTPADIGAQSQLPLFTADNILYGQGSDTPAFSAGFTYNSGSGTLGVNNAGSTDTGNIQVGGTLGNGNISGGKLTLQSTNEGMVIELPTTGSPTILEVISNTNAIFGILDDSGTPKTFAINDVIHGDTGPGFSMHTRYVHSIGLASAAVDAPIAELSVPVASFDGLEIAYRVKEVLSGKVRVGTLLIASDGLVTSITDTYTETAPIPLTFSAALNIGNLEVRYDSVNDCVMRASSRMFKA